MCLNRVPFLLISLHLQSLVDLVVILDHGQLLLLIVLTDVCLGDVLFVDNVVNFKSVTRLNLDTDDEA